MSKTVYREVVGEITPLGASAKSTIETFILNQLGSYAETQLEVSPATATHIKAASLVWEDGEVRLAVRFGVDGDWTSS
jgi:hypothetical protein